MGDKVLVTRGEKDPDIVAEGRWARWTGAALRRPGRTLAVGLVLLGALAAPAFGMKLGMPGARVVDEGRTSRDGYDMVVESFGPGAAGPAYVTVAAADAQTGHRHRHRHPQRRRRPHRRAAQPPAAASSSGSPPAPRSTSRPPPTWSTALRAQLDDAVPDAKVGGPAGQNHDLTEVLVDRGTATRSASS